ncbi:putative LRR containing protein [Trachipleistophora hominis]|uniref:Putative LRR containing protein n=1 Tax=Trachipleistophora hominis TaxID=72359 RepID=L7JYA3_TRAHO|nr:putative LRR containing protein [Trachipleistophora hominis]
MLYITLFNNETSNGADNEYFIRTDLKSLFMTSILDEPPSNVKASVNGLGITDYDIINDELDILHSKELKEICIKLKSRDKN